MTEGNMQKDVNTSISEHDLRALRAADRYLDFLAAGVAPTGDDDLSSELTELFTSWRSDIGNTPIPDTPTVDSLFGMVGDTPSPAPAVGDPVFDTAAGDGFLGGPDTPLEEAEGDVLAPENVIDIKTRRRLVWRREAVRALSGAAAFLVLAAGGLTVAIQSAGLNDPLWSVNQALFTKNANDIELATYLNRDIERARILAASGQEEEADRVLDRVQRRIDAIETDFRRNDVKKRLEHARKVVNGEDPAAAEADKRKLKEEAASDSAAANANTTSNTAASETTEPSDDSADATDTTSVSGTGKDAAGDDTADDTSTEATEPAESTANDGAPTTSATSKSHSSTAPTSSATSAASATKKSSAKKSSAKKSSAKKSSAKKSSARKSSAKKSSAAKTTVPTAHSTRSTTSSVEPTSTTARIAETARQAVGTTTVMVTRDDAE